ncbi:MAG: ParB/RepB/Spo0J family partition protein [Fibrobacter sp.]|nr:ParB/RepB/Spo0J family partition protein [Fibrobacter sp.]
MNKQNSRKALGRGLSNLIPTQFDNNDNNEEIHYVDIDSVKTNPFQPRTDFDDEEIKGLAESIDNQGLLQPVVVRKKENFFEIISGERRFRAFKFLGKNKLPCIIKNHITDREMLELALVENIQREQLNEIEKAVAYQKLILECSYTHEQLSKQIGKSRTSITNSLRLLNLPEKIQEFVRKDKISMGHARALLSINNEKEQLKLAQKIIDNNLSVRDIEKESQEISVKKNKNTNSSKKNEIEDPDILQVLDKLRYKFGTSVEIKNQSKDKGKLEISFYNQADLTRIVDLLLA